MQELTIIGGGPAGLAAALYGRRAGLEVLLVEKVGIGGQVLVTDTVENYLGFPEPILGPDLIDRMAAQVRRFGISERSAEVAGLTADGPQGAISVRLGDHSTVETRAVVVATGASPRKLSIPGEREFVGKGVSYCATCDGAFFRDKDIAVVGGGDTAVQEALFLTKFARKIYLVHRRDKLRAVEILRDKILAHPKVTPIWNTVVESIEGHKGVESVALGNLETQRQSSLEVSGVFVFIGIIPNTSFLDGLVDLDERKFVITDEWMKTSVRGIFAAGDCRAKPLRQISTAVGDGATAAYAAQHYLNV